MLEIEWDVHIVKESKEKYLKSLFDGDDAEWI